MRVALLESLSRAYIYTKNHRARDYYEITRPVYLYTPRIDKPSIRVYIRNTCKIYVVYSLMSSGGRKSASLMCTQFRRN